MIVTHKDFIRNVPEIMELVALHDHLFFPREGADAHESIIPGVCSKFKTLKSSHMSDDLISTIFKNSDFDSDLEYMYDFIQIQRYDPGDYIAPHRDSYSVRKLHLITLTTSEYDGLVCEAPDKTIIKLFDVAGQYIDFPYDAVHWVDPVKELRYSLVVAE